MIPGHNYRPRTDAERAEEIAERAAIMQYDGGMSREDADRAAVACVAAMCGEQLALLDGAPQGQPRKAARSKRR